MCPTRLELTRGVHVRRPSTARASPSRRARYSARSSVSIDMPIDRAAFSRVNPARRSSSHCSSTCSRGHGVAWVAGGRPTRAAPWHQALQYFSLRSGFGPLHHTHVVTAVRLPPARTSLDRRCRRTSSRPVRRRSDERSSGRDRCWRNRCTSCGTFPTARTGSADHGPDRQTAGRNRSGWCEPAQILHAEGLAAAAPKHERGEIPGGHATPSAWRAISACSGVSV